MSLDKTKQLIDWLETNHANHQFSIGDMKELLSIAMSELADQNDKTFDALPGGIITAIIDSMKASGEYYRLDNKIEKYKSQFLEQTG